LFDSHSGFSYQNSAEAVPKSCNVSTIFLLFFIFFLKHNQKGCDTYLLDLTTTWQILKYNNKYSNFFAFVLKPETQNNNFDNMQKNCKKQPNKML